MLYIVETFIFSSGAFGIVNFVVLSFRIGSAQHSKTFNN